jgi:predicted nucleic acid-binding protein
VIAALCGWHDRHDKAAEALARVTALPGHVALEAYSVLTRLPAGLAVSAATAADVLARRFGDAPLILPGAQRGVLVARLAGAGVSGGGAYDGLVALEAAEHGRTLLTLDRRAQVTYQRLGIPFHVIDG